MIHQQTFYHLGNVELFRSLSNKILVDNLREMYDTSKRAEIPEPPGMTYAYDFPRSTVPGSSLCHTWYQGTVAPGTLVLPTKCNQSSVSLVGIYGFLPAISDGTPLKNRGTTKTIYVDLRRPYQFPVKVLALSISNHMLRASLICLT